MPMINQLVKPSIYVASKIWHAEEHKKLRDEHGFNINSRWIDYGEDHPIVQRKDELWQTCYEDVRDCDFVLVYSGADEEEHRGVLVEVGMAYGFGKPVYAINKSKSFKACQISDVAFTHYENWEWLNARTLVAGAHEAVLRNILRQK